MIDVDFAAPRRAADGSTTEGRKGVPYLRDHYLPIEVDELLERLARAAR